MARPDFDASVGDLSALTRINSESDIIVVINAINYLPEFQEVQIDEIESVGGHKRAAKTHQGSG